MRDLAEVAFAPLVGLPMCGMHRASSVLTVQFGEPRVIDGVNGDHPVGAFALHVSCPWRLSEAQVIRVASGDLFTPVDPEADLETFEWDVTGANWWDVKVAEFLAEHSTSLVVTTFVCDDLSGVRLVLSEGVELEVFPNSSRAPHVDTEYWRVLRPGESDAHIVAGTFGIVMEEGS